MDESYADVILPLAVKGTYTYSVPPEWRENLRPGMRVVVPLGRRKFLTGVVHRVHGTRPDYRTVKPVAAVAGDDPVALPPQMETWEWIASYYLCTLGEVMNAAIPTAMKSKGFHPSIREKYREKTEVRLCWGPSIRSVADVEKAVESLRRAKAQQHALVRLFDVLSENFDPEAGVSKAQFVRKESVSYTHLRELEKKGWIRTRSVTVSRQAVGPAPATELPRLTEAQQRAAAEIGEFWKDNKPVLLHGVTGSGKTEIYIRYIAGELADGRDVLYLLPEIALTAQLVERLRTYFGDRVVVYHSRFNDNLRAECYLNLLDKDREPVLLVGVRSSVLLPLRNPGLIIVDEEHENSYKQSEPAPRYHARDVALVLSGMYGARILLGSATPSVESYYHAVTGKYGLVRLTERYGGAALPEIRVCDIRSAARRGEYKAHFSRMLLLETDAAIKTGRQAVLFQNRRGFSPYLECGECLFIPQCPHCNVSLTYHKSDHTLVCHYCGFRLAVPEKCPQCKAGEMKTRGFGTEKIEEELSAIFPDARIARLDLDTTRSARGFTRIVSDFAKGRIDLLVGTQMVTKGFDFEKVSVAGILNADNLLNYPDFRAAERSFQLMTQVAGRAGRRDTPGKVVIQTSQPDHPVIRQVKEGDYEGMFRAQTAERQRFLYPPFCRLIRFTLKHRNKPLLDRAAEEFGGRLRRVFGRRVLGPEVPVVLKVRDEYLVNFLLKIEKKKSFRKAKGLIINEIDNFNSNGDFRSVRVVADVDPQ